MRHIPNLLSFFRIVLIPLFVWEMMEGNTLEAAIILGVSGITDMFDGLLARKFNWVSQFGKILDPIADKLTQIAVCIVLAIKLRQFWPFFSVLLLKELCMLVMGGYLLKKKVKLEGAKWFGKIVTVLFYITTTSIVLIPGMPNWLSATLLTLTTCGAIASALLYLPEFFRYKENINR